MNEMNNNNDVSADSVDFNTDIDIDMLTDRENIDRWLEKEPSEFFTNDFFNLLFNLSDECDKQYFLSEVRAKMKQSKRLTEFNKMLNAKEKDAKRQLEEFRLSNHETMPVYLEQTLSSGKIYFKPNLYAEYFMQEYEGLYKVFRLDNDGKKIYFYNQSDGVYKEFTKSDLLVTIRETINAYGNMGAKNSYSTKDVREAYENIVAGSDFPDINSLHECIPENAVNFKNGILLLPQMKLVPHDKKYFTINQIPCEWKPRASDPTRFNKFMDDLFGDRDDTKLFIMEWIGLIISNISFCRHNFKKALILQGESNSGKSQLKGLAENLIGKENYASIDLGTLEKEHQSAAIVNKRLIGSSDMVISYLKDKSTFMNIIGSDYIHINPKGEKPYSVKYSGFMWNCCNELPKISGEQIEAFYKRFIIVKTNEAVPEEQRDSLLLEHLMEESEGIIKLCINALVNLIERGYKLTIPKENDINLPAYQLEMNMAAQFYEECCTPIQSGDKSSVQDVREAFERWYAVNGGGSIPSVRSFNANLASFLKLKSKDDLYVWSNTDEFKGKRYAFGIRHTADDTRFSGITINY